MIFIAMMTTEKRIAFIVLVWVILAVAILSWIVTWPVRDIDDYSTMFLITVVFSVVPWLINLILILGICLSLARRMTRARRWILAIWALCLVSPVLVDFIQIHMEVDPYGWKSIPNSLDAFAYPWLFALLLILCVAVLIEDAVNFVKELRQRG